MQTYPITAHALSTAQQYAETAGSLAEALYNFLLRRPLPRAAPDDAAARAAYAQELGSWYTENSDLLAAGLTACRLLSDGAALLLDDTREAAGSAAETPSAPPDGANAAGLISSLPEPSNAGSTVLSRLSASTKAQTEVHRQLSQPEHAADQTRSRTPGGVLFYRQALTGQRTPARKQKGRANTSAER